MHANKQIRDALVAALQTMPTAGSNTDDRLWPAPTRPYVRVLFTREELPEEFQTMGEKKYDRFAFYAVEIRVEGEDHQDQLDQIRFEVEQAIEADDTLGLTGVKIELSEVGSAEYEAEGDNAIALLPVNYQAHYRTTAADPGTLIE